MGQCRWLWGKKANETWGDDNTTLEIQKKVLGHEETLRRVIAHELCHHEVALLIAKPKLLEIGYETYKRYQNIFGPDGHGKEWKEVAKRFDAKYGADFVTEKSDKDTVVDDQGKEIFVLLNNYVYGRHKQRLGWQWAVGLSRQAMAYLDGIDWASGEFKLVKTTDSVFTKGRGRIKQYTGWNLPRTPEQEQKLQDLWANAPMAKFACSPIQDELDAIEGAKEANSGPHKNATAHINLSPDAAAKMYEAATQIPDEELGEDGREDEAHITIKYGIKADSALLSQVVADQKPFTVTLGKTHVFEVSESSDAQAPIVVEAHAPELEVLHDMVNKAMSTRKDDFDYKPHVTLAYVKPEAAAKYDGLDWVEGVTFEVNDITLSQKGGGQVRVPFGKPLKSAAYKPTKNVKNPTKPFTETPEFKAWFGASKVVDKHGNPLIVYHGTPSSDIQKFEKEYSGDYLAFFSTDPKFASLYSSPNKDPGGNVMPVYLKIEDPFDFRTDEGQSTALDWLEEVSPNWSEGDYEYERLVADATNKTPEELVPEDYSNYDRQAFMKQIREGNWVVLELPGFINYIKQMGHDGVILIELGTVNYAVFEANQIKSATGNTGKFDPEQGEITASHKTPPMSDTQYENPEMGEETNAYADIPECVKGVEDLPSLETLSPALFKTGAQNFKPMPFDNWCDANPMYQPDDFNEAGYRYDENVAHFSTVDFPITIYRAVQVETGTQPNLEHAGVYWTWVENSADAYFGSGSMWDQGGPHPKNPQTVILKAKVLRSTDVDWDATLLANMLNEEENEITVVAGAELRLVGIEYGDGYRKPIQKTVVAYGDDSKNLPMRGQKGIGGQDFPQLEENPLFPDEEKTARAAEEPFPIPQYLYHGTDKKNLDAILNGGLRVEFNESNIEWQKATYLACDQTTAANYAGHKGVKPENWIILQITVSNLRQDLLRPDDYDFPDVWERYSGDIEPWVKEEYGDNWALVPWEVSLKYSCQVAYLGDIPANAIKVIPTPKFGSLLKTADAESYFTGLDSIAESVIQEFDSHRNDPSYRQKWDVVPAARLKKIWNDYAKTGIVRDEKGMDDITWRILENIWKIHTNTILCGHTDQASEQFVESVMGEEYVKDLPNIEDVDYTFFDDDSGQWRLTDYALDKLVDSAIRLEQAQTAEQKLQAVDRILNIVHARSDLASWFVQGGTSTLNSLAGYKKASGSTQMLPDEVDMIADVAHGMGGKSFPKLEKTPLFPEEKKEAGKVAKQYGPVYHGTHREWSDEIQIDQYKIGKFFSSDPLVAQAYGTFVHECYLTMNKPLIVDAKGSGYSSIPTPKKLKGWVAEGMDTVDTDILAKYAYENGYDGAIIKNVYELHHESLADDYIVFKPTQVKQKGIIEPEIDPYTANKYHKQELQRRQKRDWEAKYPEEATTASTKTAASFQSFNAWLKKMGGIGKLLSEYDVDEAETYGYGLEDPSNPAEVKSYQNILRKRAVGDFRERYENLVAEYQGWQFPMDVFRCISLPKAKDAQQQHLFPDTPQAKLQQGLQAIKYQGVGIYWSWEEGAAECHWGTGGPSVTLHGVINEDNVDWEGTIYSNMFPSLGENEKEVRLLEGTQFELEGIQYDKKSGWSQPPVRTVTASVKGQVYLLHFDIDPKEEVPSSREDAKKPFHARHYMGWSENAQERIDQHYKATSGVKLIEAIHAKGISFTVARIWDNVDRDFERRMKNQGGLNRHCPICKKLGLIPASRYRGKALEKQVAPETPEAGPDFVEIEKNAAAADLANLRSYLTPSRRDMGEELARIFSGYWRQFVENEHPEFLENLDEDEYMDDFSMVSDDILSDFLEQYGSQAMQDDPANAPTFLTVDYRRDVKNAWLVHFTDHPEEIAKNGFKFGMDRVETLALTTYFKDEAKKMGGYNFAIDAHHRNLEGLGKDYGRHCVLFQANGIETYHTGDDFEQIIFWGKDAKNIIPIFNDGYSTWSIQDQDGNPLFEGGLSEVVDYAIANAASLLPKKAPKKPKAQRAVAKLAASEIPLEPGETQIPAGTVRLYHYTKSRESFESIKKQGLLASFARGDDGSGSGPSAGIWASTRPPGDTHLFVELYLSPEQISHRAEYPRKEDSPEEWAKGYHHVIANGDVPLNQIVAFHEPFHHHVRYLMEDGTWEELMERDPKIVDAANDGSAFSKAPDGEAVRWMAERYGTGKQASEKTAAEPWEMARNEYSPYPPINPETQMFEEEPQEATTERYKKNNHWEQLALAAVSEGKLAPEEAKARGLYLPGTFKPLPANLYHVTTAADQVMSGGLKTRYQLSMDQGTGLGGGTDKAVSFTDDLATAQSIYLAMVEGRKVASGEFTLQQMIDMATKGTTASRPWIYEAITWGGAYYTGDKKWNVGQPWPDHIQALLDGKKIEQVSMGKRQDQMGNAEPIGEGWMGGDGMGRWVTWMQPLSDAELQDRTFDFYKTWAAARENAGGPMNPLFFSTNIPALASTPIEQIAILQFKPIAGAMGTRESALGEWRTYSGNAVQFVSKVDPYAKTAALTPKDRVFYHGTNKEGDFTELSGLGHGIIWLAEKQDAESYANQHYQKGQSRMFKVILKPDAKIIDLRDLNEPLVQQIKKNVDVWRGSNGYPPMSDEEFVKHYTDYGVLEGRPANVELLKNNGVDGVICNDVYSGNKRGKHVSVALFNPDAIQSQTVEPIVRGSSDIVKAASDFAKFAFFIEVPKDSRGHFWDEPPAHNLEFWAFKGRPAVLPNEKVYFTFDKMPVAETTVLKVEKPGESICELTGKYEKHWKLYWEPKQFTKYARDKAPVVKTAAPTHESLLTEHDAILYHPSRARVDALPIVAEAVVERQQKTIASLLYHCKEYLRKSNRKDRKYLGEMLGEAENNLHEAEDFYATYQNTFSELGVQNDYTLSQATSAQESAIILMHRFFNENAPSSREKRGSWRDVEDRYEKWIYHPDYGAFSRIGKIGPHADLVAKTMGKEMASGRKFDEVDRGYAEIDRDEKTVTLENAPSNPLEDGFIANAVVDMFKKKFPKYTILIPQESKAIGVTAAPKSIWYHGTSLKNLQSIMSQGLVPEGTEKVWADDPDASITAPSRQSYGGTYVTQNLMTATGAPNTEDKKARGGCLVVIMELQPNTMYLDEDNVTGVLGAPIKHLSDNTFHVLCYYLAATQEGAAETWQQEIEGMRDDYIGKCLTQWGSKFAERGMSFHPELKKELEKLLPSVWLAAVTRAAGHVKDNYAYIRSWDQVFYGTPKEKQRPDMNTVLPDGAEGEAAFREAAEKVTRTLRLLARPSTESSKNQLYNMNTSRVNEPIGFSGSNHILAIVEIRDRQTPAQMILHWGTIPPDFFSQWNTKFGSKYEVTDARKVQPKAKGVAASAHEDAPQVFYHGTSWEAAEQIDKEGLKAGSDSLDTKKPYVWCAIAEYAAKEYGMSTTDSEQFAVIEFIWDYSKSEPDSEHFEEGDMYRRIEGDIPRSAITKISYYNDGRVVKTAAKSKPEQVARKSYPAEHPYEAMPDPRFIWKDGMVSTSAYHEQIACVAFGEDPKKVGVTQVGRLLHETGAVRIYGDYDGWVVEAKNEPTPAQRRALGTICKGSEVVWDLGNESGKGSLGDLWRAIDQVWGEGKTAAIASKQATSYLKSQLILLKGRFAETAQKVYDEWEQDEQGVDEVLGAGGICAEIANAIAEVIARNAIDCQVTEGGQEGDDHSWLLVYDDDEAWGIDIPHSLYETGGGYNWKKIPDVTFTANDVEIFPLDIDPKQLKEGSTKDTAAPEYLPWIGVDLDGTIAYDMQPFVPLAIGPPILAMVEKIKKAIAEGHTVKVFTARLADGENRDQLQRLIRAYTKKYIGVALDSTNEKDPGMITIWDDKAREVEKNTGEFMDNPQVKGASFKEANGLKKMPAKIAVFLKQAALKDAMSKCAACSCGGCIEHDKFAAEGFGEEGFWSGEGNAASGILLICPTTGRIGLAWRSPDVDRGNCFGTIGGAVKKGMTPQESAKEELGEETGYRGGITLHPAFVFTA